MWLSLKSDEEVYGWKDDIYARSPLMGFSNPVNFQHKIHVGFDPTTGNFTVSGVPGCASNGSVLARFAQEYLKHPSVDCGLESPPAIGRLPLMGCGDFSSPDRNAGVAAFSGLLTPSTSQPRRIISAG